MANIRKRPRHLLINVGTQDSDIANASDALWYFSDKITKEILASNLSSNARDKIGRLTTRMQHYAKELGKALSRPDQEAFSTKEGTRAYLNRLLEQQK